MSRKKRGKDRKLKIYNEIRRLPLHMPDLNLACDDSKNQPGFPVSSSDLKLSQSGLPSVRI